MYHSEDNNCEIDFFDLQLVIEAYDRFLTKCIRLTKIYQILKIQAKGFSKENDELSKELTSSKEETRELQMSITKIKDELTISRREKDKSILKHEKLVKDTTNAKDIRCLNRLIQDNHILVVELHKIYGDNRGLKMLIRKSKNHMHQEEVREISNKLNHFARTKENTPKLRFQSCVKSLANTTNKKDCKVRWVPKAQILKLSDVR